MMSFNQLYAFVFVLFLVGQNAFGQSDKLYLPAIYSDHMVLQRDTTVIKGTAFSGQTVAVTLGKYSTNSTADSEGNWEVVFYGIDAGGPYELTISTNKASKTFKDVLIGDVWVASGQSNMEWALKNGVIGWQEEKQQANYENIRFLHITKEPQGIPQTHLKNHQWERYTPESLEKFSAVAYYFSKFLHESQNIPIGIVHTSYGGSRIETWMSEKALQASGVAHEPIWLSEQFDKKKKQSVIDEAYRREVFEKINVGERLGVEKQDYDDAEWEEMDCTQDWRETALKDAGFVWFRKQFEVQDKASWGDSCTVSLGRVRHRGIVYLNGEKIGKVWDAPNHTLSVSTSQLAKGINTLAVRIVKYWGESAGFRSEASELYIAPQENAAAKISLAGTWKFHRALEPTFPGPLIFHSKPTLLFNGMVAPLTPIKVKGFLWYQGESNANRNADDYDDLLKAMISDWRALFNTRQAPFLVVQLPNYLAYKEQPSDDNWPRLREAQANTQSLSNVFVANIIDLGDPQDVHPRNKKDVGYRLSLIARKEVYGEKLVHTGPTLKSVKFKGDKAIIEFDNVGKGLVSQDGKAIEEFALAGKDGSFYWGKAQIINKKTIVVTSENVKQPVAVRYAWQNNPRVNLYNKEGFPAMPFRTDEWPPSETD